MRVRLAPAAWEVMVKNKLETDSIIECGSTCFKRKSTCNVFNYDRNTHVCTFGQVNKIRLCFIIFVPTLFQLFCFSEHDGNDDDGVVVFVDPKSKKELEKIPATNSKYATTVILWCCPLRSLTNLGIFFQGWGIFYCCFPSPLLK